MAEIQKKITDCFQKKDKKFDEDTKCPPKISSGPSHDAAPALKPAPKPSSFEMAPKKKDAPLPAYKSIDLTKRKALAAEYKQERKLTSERAEKLASKHTLEKNQVTKYFQRLREADPSYEKRSYSTKKSREPLELVLINAFNESTVLSEKRAKDLGKETGLTPSQVHHWFARRREAEEKQTIRPERLNDTQEAALEVAFQESSTLSVSRAEALAQSLKCTFAQVEYYFHIRRGQTGTSQRQVLAGTYYPLKRPIGYDGRLKGPNIKCEFFQAGECEVCEDVTRQCVGKKKESDGLVEPSPAEVRLELGDCLKKTLFGPHNIIDTRDASSRPFFTDLASKYSHLIVEDVARSGSEALGGEVQTRICYAKWPRAYFEAGRAPKEVVLPLYQPQGFPPCVLRSGASLSSSLSSIADLMDTAYVIPVQVTVAGDPDCLITRHIELGLHVPAGAEINRAPTHYLIY
jgi:hypothetical protein